MLWEPVPRSSSTPSTTSRSRCPWRRQWCAAASSMAHRCAVRGARGGRPVRGDGLAEERRELLDHDVEERFPVALGREPSRDEEGDDPDTGRGMQDEPGHQGGLPGPWRGPPPQVVARVGAGADSARYDSSASRPRRTSGAVARTWWRYADRARGSAVANTLTWTLPSPTAHRAPRGRRPRLPPRPPARPRQLKVFVSVLPSPICTPFASRASTTLAADGRLPSSRSSASAAATTSWSRSAPACASTAVNSACHNAGSLSRASRIRASAPTPAFATQCVVRVPHRAARGVGEPGRRARGQRGHHQFHPTHVAPVAVPSRFTAPHGPRGGDLAPGLWTQRRPAGHARRVLVMVCQLTGAAAVRPWSSSRLLGLGRG